MKARIKATGEIVEFTRVIDKYIMTHHSLPITFDKDELDFDIEDDLDYWTRLEHQAVITAMGGICGNTSYNELTWESMAEDAIRAAHAIVEKLKKEEK